MKQRSARTFWSVLLTIGLMLSTLGAPPANAAQALGDFYNSTSIHEVYLSIDAASITNLDKTPKDYTAAKVEFKTSNGSASGQISIGLRLKGSTSLEKLTGRPSFKLKFNWKDLKGNRFLGLKAMTLNALTQDNSLIHEAAAYRLFNSMGIPASKTGYAKVFVNGSLKGLYLNVETPDDIFLSKRFADPTQHLYEAQAFKDLMIGNDSGGENTGKFWVDEGWGTTPNKLDLKKLIEVANISSPTAWWTAMNKYTNRSLLIKQFAVENFLGHWDSYSGPIINNHFWRSNDKGVFTMIPWGVDQTFGENRQTPALGDDYFFSMDALEVGYPWVMQSHKKAAIPRGLLFQRCLKHKPCKTEYLTNLKLVSAKATSSNLVGFMTNTAKLVQAFSSENNKQEQTRSIAWLKKQQTNVANLMKKHGIK